MNLHIRDPRLSAAEADIRPVVARSGRDLPLWVLVGGVLLGGVLLFTTLDARRRALTAPTTQAPAMDVVQASAPLPPLYIIPEPAPPPAPLLSDAIEVVATPTPSPSRPSPPPSPPPFAPQPPPPNYTPPPWASSPPPMAHSPAPPASSGAVLVIDVTTGPARAANANDGASDASRAGEQTVQATRLDRRATTVPRARSSPLCWRPPLIPHVQAMSGLSFLAT